MVKQIASPAATARRRPDRIPHALFESDGAPERFRKVRGHFSCEDMSKSVGISSCQRVQIPVGKGVLVGALWNRQRIGSCTPYLAKAICRDQAQARFPYLQSDGRDYWLNFTVCP